MYNTYLLPIYDAELAICYIDHIKAIDLEHAKEKFIIELCEEYDIAVDSWEDLEFQLCENRNLIIGELYDKEEF